MGEFRFYEVGEGEYISKAKSYTVVVRKDHGERFCKRCRSRCLVPDVLSAENYKMQMPGTDKQMRHAIYVPKYDRQVKSGKKWSNGCEGKTRAQILQEAAAWRTAVREAFAAKGRLTTEELQAIIPCCYSVYNAPTRCREAGLRIKLVSRVCRKGIRGPGIGVYVLPGVSPETIH